MTELTKKEIKIGKKPSFRMSRERFLPPFLAAASASN